MVSKLDLDELKMRLMQLDAELDALGLPLRFRPMHCFKALYGSVPDGDFRRDLFDPITDWFITKYGERAQWDGVIGRIPVLLRGEVYLVRVPFVIEDTVMKFTDRFEQLPDRIASTFTPDEFEELGRKVSGMTMCFLKLYNLTVDDGLLDQVERDHIWMGMFDLENAASVLKISGDTRNSIFHSHAAAEKFLKVALKRSGSTIKLRSFGHDLPKVFAELIKAEPRYAWVKSSVDLLQTAAPDMQIRYQMLPRTPQNAISVFNAALNVCGALAQMWMFDAERGTTVSSFKPGRFYLDGRRWSFFCRDIVTTASNESLAQMVLFRIDPKSGQSLIMEINLSPSVSALYLEVKDETVIRDLRDRYEFQMRNPGRLVEAKELGIEISSGPEGCYVTGRYDIKVS